MKRILLALLILAFSGCALGSQQTHEFLQSIADSQPMTDRPDFDVEETSESVTQSK